MKSTLLSLFAIASLAHATPPVLSLTQAALHKVDPNIMPDHYDIARTDLNADGKGDIIALMNGKSGYRGSGGTTMFILKGTADGFASLGSIKVVNEPIYARKSVKNGLRDLLVTVHGGGATPGLAALSFDGKKYPASPGDVGAKVEDSDELLFAEPTPPFDKKEELQGITFQVFSPNNRSGNTLTVTSGLMRITNPSKWTSQASSPASKPPTSTPTVRRKSMSMDSTANLRYYSHGVLTKINRSTRSPCRISMPRSRQAIAAATSSR
jgi:hypothetical protein